MRQEWHFLIKSHIHHIVSVHWLLFRSSIAHLNFMAEKKCIFFVIFVWYVYKLFVCLISLGFIKDVVLRRRCLILDVLIGIVIVYVLLARVRSNGAWHFHVSFFEWLVAPLWWHMLWDKVFTRFHPSTKSWFTDVLLGRRIQRPFLISHWLSVVREIFAVWHELGWAISWFWSWYVWSFWWFNLKLFHIWAQYLINLLVKPLLIIHIILP